MSNIKDPSKEPHISADIYVLDIVVLSKLHALISLDLNVVLKFEIVSANYQTMSSEVPFLGLFSNEAIFCILRPSSESDFDY